MFRGIHPKVHLGAASDRYAGWMGQIYLEEYKISKRSKSVGAEKVTEQTVEVRSTREFFQHFEFVELDFTFYEPLLDRTGRPTRTHRTLATYADFMPSDARVTLKVPQIVTAHKTWVFDPAEKSRNFADNPRFHDPEVFTEQFYRPANALLGPKLSGFIFEHEYQRTATCPPPNENIKVHETFFGRIPQDSRYHIEERTDRLKSGDYFRFLRERGIGNVFSHWSFLPALDRQLEQAGGFTNPRTAIIRLLTPRGVKYEDAYRRYFPFAELKDEDPKMFDDTVALAKKAIEQEVEAWVTVNNRAGGNAPQIARRIKERFLASPSEKRDLQEASQ